MLDCIDAKSNFEKLRAISKSIKEVAHNLISMINRLGKKQVDISWKTIRSGTVAH